MNNQTVLIQANAAIPFFNEKNLPPLSCQLKQAQLTCFLGHKFRLVNIYLQMLAGLTSLQSGAVDYFIEPQATPAHTHFPCIAYLNYHSNLLSVLNGVENVTLPALYHQLGSSDEIDRQAAALLAELDYGADHLILPSFMLTLQKRHLLIARALMLHPKMLFIENPFADLELEEAVILGRYLAELVTKKGLTLVTSQANLDFVKDYAQQIIYADYQQFDIFQDWASFFEYKQRFGLKF
jgi:ABC-type multidrug transport system ATPase subunit